MLFGSLFDTYVKKKYIIDTVNKLFIRQRKPKYSNEFLVDHILECTLNYQSWSKYNRVLNQYTDLPKYFSKYLNEIYIKWTNLDIFKIAYVDIINDNIDKTNITQKNIVLNTDATCISNMRGKENIGLNPEYTKKNVTKLGVTKLGVINTIDNIPIGVFPIDNKQILDTYNTLCHDSTSIQPLLNNLLVSIDKECNIQINADKAYITNNKYVYKNKDIEIVTPIKHKSIKQSNKELKKYIEECTNENKIKTKTKRYLIENYFCSIKHISKLYLRTDKLIKTFMSTVYIGFMYCYKLSY